MILGIFKHTLIYLFIVLPLEILGSIILPFVLPFIPKSQEHLPYLVRWFDNHESYYPGQEGQHVDGLAGPKAHRDKNGLTENSSFIKLYWERYRWLALRNPLNYFQYKHLGVLISEAMMKDYVYSYVGDPYVDGSDPRDGFYKLTFQHKATHKKYFECHRKMTIPFFPNYYMMIRLGWKIRHPLNKKAGDVEQWVFTPPFTRIRKKEGK